MNYTGSSSFTNGVLPMTGVGTVWWLGPTWLTLLAMSLLAAGSAVLFLVRRQKMRP